MQLGTKPDPHEQANSIDENEKTENEFIGTIKKLEYLLNKSEEEDINLYRKAANIAEKENFNFYGAIKTYVDVGKDNPSNKDESNGEYLKRKMRQMKLLICQDAIEYGINENKLNIIQDQSNFDKFFKDCVNKRKKTETHTIDIDGQDQQIDGIKKSAEIFRKIAREGAKNTIDQIRMIDHNIKKYAFNIGRVTYDAFHGESSYDKEKLLSAKKAAKGELNDLLDMIGLSHLKLDIP